MHRRELKKAPYNPRLIDKSAAKKLRENIKANGMLQPPIWNKQTGNVVGGHQRLTQLDGLEGSDDYYLDVAVVDLTPKKEREANIFLNNIAAQGSWDFGLLSDMFKGGELELDATGFDMADLQTILEDPSLTPEFLSENDPAKAEAEEIVDIKTRNAAMRQKKKDWQQKKDAERTTDNHVVVVFDNGAEVSAFLERVCGATDSKFLDGHNMARLLDIELPKVPRRVDQAANVANKEE